MSTFAMLQWNVGDIIIDIRSRGKTKATYQTIFKWTTDAISGNPYVKLVMIY